MQGFLESGPQATLQLSLLFYGSSSRSKQMLIEPHLPSSINQSIFDPINSNDYVTDEVFQNHDLIPTLNETSDTIDIFGRIYDKGTYKAPMNDMIKFLNVVTYTLVSLMKSWDIFICISPTYLCNR